MSWIDDFVSEIDCILADYDRDMASDLVTRLRLKFIDEGVKVKFGMESRRMQISAGEAPRFVPSDENYIHDLEGFRARLLEVKAERLDPLSVHYQPTMSVTVNVDIANCISIIQELPETTLSDDDKTTLAGMLSMIQAMEGEKKKSKIAETVKWIGDKAVDVVIAVLPTLASMV